MTDPSEAESGLSRAEHAAAMADYLVDGRRRALDLGNRGPLRFDDKGRLHADIRAAYWEHGFYVFDHLIDPDEVAELGAGIEGMLDRAPVRAGAELDAHGRPALGRDYAVEPFLFIKPLSDPWGGTKLLAGRHPTKMTEPVPEVSAPDEVVHLISGMCQASPAALRLYGHPSLLAIAESINGPDFVPFNDAIFVKKPGLGGSVSWHQDGATHWDNPDWDEGIHGFNFQVQLYASTPANGLWAVPGSHKHGKIDIPRVVADNGGSDRLPDAVPLFCDAGGVTIANRQVLHGSFANTSTDPRISITFGFHRRTSVLGVEGLLKMKPGGRGTVYDEDRIFDRSAVIAVAIDARHRRFPAETPYRYQPFAGLEDDFRFDDDTFVRVIRNYNLKDLSI
ncbi:MAG: phytanoyl-CoA dioxygenase family protein [Actinomycetia bacterium]|nr:phytanoyl-CoA dioxygenase family protein [Actinomycetes bacterium]